MGITYFGSRISQNMTKTPEGYLVCMNVPVARTGDQQYLARELQIRDKEPNEIVTVHRTEDEVFSKETIASFEGKPFTDNHPEEDVTISNNKIYSIGHCQNVHRGTGDNALNLVADIYVTDPTVVGEIESGKRQISCGYTCDYLDNGDGTYSQSKIRGNHIALVEEGRAGATVSIKDSQTKEISEMENTKEEKSMMSNLLSLLNKVITKDNNETKTADAVPPAPQQDNTALKNALLTASLALNEAITYLGNNAPAQAPAQPAAPTNAPENNAEANENPVENTAAGNDDIQAEIDKLGESEDDSPAEESVEEQDTEASEDTDEEEPKDKKNTFDALAEELKTNDKDIEDVETEDDEDEEDKDEDDEESDEDGNEVVAPDNFTKDSMANFIKNMKPYIANISNDQEREMVTDAFVRNFRKATADSNSLQKIMEASESVARQNVQDQKPMSAEDRQAVYDRFNPHSSSYVQQ